MKPSSVSSNPGQGSFSFPFFLFLFFMQTQSKLSEYIIRFGLTVDNPNYTWLGSDNPNNVKQKDQACRVDNIVCCRRVLN